MDSYKVGDRISPDLIRPTDPGRKDSRVGFLPPDLHSVNSL